MIWKLIKDDIQDDTSLMYSNPVSQAVQISSPGLEEKKQPKKQNPLTGHGVLLIARLTVAVVAGVDAAFESLHLCKLGQHLGEGAAALVRRRARALLHAVVPLRKLQRQIPEGLHCVGLVLAGQTRHLWRNNSQVCHRGRDVHSRRSSCPGESFSSSLQALTRCRLLVVNKQVIGLGD